MTDALHENSGKQVREVGSVRELGIAKGPTRSCAALASDLHNEPDDRFVRLLYVTVTVITVTGSADQKGRIGRSREMDRVLALVRDARSGRDQALLLNNQSH
jgi:hypothetical protein